MNKSHKRKLPIGWRRLTPTEKITAECMFCGKERLERNTPKIEYWSAAFISDIGKKEKETTDATNYIYIKPISPKPTTSP